MMEQREKLIELILNFYDGDSICDTCEKDKRYFRCNECLSTHEADYLIENGVVVLPCRCGECAYCEDGNVPWCNYLQIGVSKDAYCAGGKRKGGDE